MSASVPLEKDFEIVQPKLGKRTVSVAEVFTLKEGMGKQLYQ